MNKTAYCISYSGINQAVDRIYYEGMEQIVGMNHPAYCEIYLGMSYSVYMFDLTEKKYISSGWQLFTNEAKNWKIRYPECICNF